MGSGKVKLRKCIRAQQRNKKYANKPVTGVFAAVHITFIKNEIYASYHYKFKDDRWNNVFAGSFDRSDDNLKASVDDSLSDIEKYNIKWLDSKLRVAKSSALASR